MGVDDGNRQMAPILTLVLSDGLPAVEAACIEVKRDGVCSADLILNILARQCEPAAPMTIMKASLALRLNRESVADYARYDSLSRAM